MRKKKGHQEEHADEGWLLPYSDMLTLLLALFIVMFAMGQTDNAKFTAMAKEFNMIFSGGNGMMDNNGSAMISTDTSTVTPKSKAQIEEDTMAQIKNKLDQEVSQEGYGDKVKVDLNAEGLVITIQDVVLFNSGEADVLKDVSPILNKISGMLNGLDNDIRVLGYTDNVPINNGKFGSNWELSAMRAINVMNYMVSTGQINQANISIQAYGDQKPKYSNDTEDGRAKNRRVEICVIRKYQTATATASTPGV